MRRTIMLLNLMAVCVMCAAKGFAYKYYGVTFKCEIRSQGVCITSFDTDAGKVVIPATVTHGGTSYAVKKISTFATSKFYKTTLLILEEGIEEIDKYAFLNFKSLHTVSLPSTIKIIGKKAFDDRGKTTYNLPSSIDEVALRDGEKIEAEMASKEEHLLAQAELARQKGERGRKKNNEEQDRLKQNTSVEITRKGGVSNIDINIPYGNHQNRNTYCVVIANEKYSDAPIVDFAENDGKTFRNYCIKTLGIPEKQIRTFYNASYTDMKRAFNWIYEISRVAGKDSRIIVYYAGHGLPCEKDNSAYLMPSDCFPKDVTTCFMLHDIYQRLGKLNVQSVTVFLDACFSGMQRGEDKALVAARSVATRPREESLTGNVVVISATSNEETALAYHEQKHGLFTYYLLQKLKDTKGEACLGDLFLFVSSEVQKASLIENDKLQTPSVNASLSMKDKWMNIKF